MRGLLIFLTCAKAPVQLQTSPYPAPHSSKLRALEIMKCAWQALRKSSILSTVLTPAAHLMVFSCLQYLGILGWVHISTCLSPPGRNWWLYPGGRTFGVQFACPVSVGLYLNSSLVAMMWAGITWRQRADGFFHSSPDILLGFSARCTNLLSSSVCH